MVRYPNYAGVEKRIKARLLALGYGDEDRIDVARFIREHGYDPRVFYPWLKRRTPSPENLERLARDLKTSPAWLAFGERVPAPIGGGSANDESPPLLSPLSVLDLIGYLRRLFMLGRTPAYA